MEEPLFMFQLIIAVDVSEHRSIYNKLNAPCSGDFKSEYVFSHDITNDYNLLHFILSIMYMYVIFTNKM